MRRTACRRCCCCCSCCRYPCAGRVLLHGLAPCAACLHCFPLTCCVTNHRRPFNADACPTPIQLLAPQLHSVPLPAAATAAGGKAGTGTTSSGAPFTEAAAALLASLTVSTPAEGGGAEGAGAEKVGLGTDQAHPLEKWAGRQLAVDGEDQVGQLSHLQYLLLASTLLVQPLLSQPVTAASGVTASQPQQLDEARVARALATCPTWLWWALRVTAMHQHMLAGKAGTLLARTNALSKHLLPAVKAAAVTAASAATSGSGNSSGNSLASLASDPQLLSCLYIELALQQYSYGYVEAAQLLLEQAGDALGLHVELAGGWVGGCVFLLCVWLVPVGSGRGGWEMR